MIKKLIGKKDESAIEPEAKLPEPHSSQSGTTYGYTVEAKVDHYTPHRQIEIPLQHSSQPLILTEEWKQVSFWKGTNPAGVPTAGCGHDQNLFLMHGLLERGSAIALAYTLAAQHSTLSLTAIKIRLRCHKLQYAHKMFHDGEPEELTEHFGKIDKLFANQQQPPQPEKESRSEGL